MLTPFLKQCFVTVGVSLSMMQMGLISGYTSILLPQLSKPESLIPIDVNSGSWIAALPALTILIGNYTAPVIMGKFGRKKANLVCVLMTIIGWMCIVLARDITILLVVRGLQGIVMGMVAALGPVLIGEYTSPRNRGAFLMTISISIGVGVLAIHTIGSYLTWQTTALICIAVTLIDLVIVILSPESPIWLADQGKYDECQAIFRWLRGDKEEDELEQLVEISKASKNAKGEPNLVTDNYMTKIRKSLEYLKITIKKNEFYKPIIIMIHVYTMGQWSGVNILTSYAYDLIYKTIGKDVNVPLMVISFGCNRIISNTVALILIKKVRRKQLLRITMGLNILTMLAISGYTFSKEKNWISFTNEYVGVALIHILTLSIGMGALPMSYILAGELLPLQFKSIAGGITTSFFSINLFITLKTTPILLESINMHGLLLAYAGVQIYCLIVVLIMLPETKDKTLLQIEQEFKRQKKPAIEEFSLS